MLPDRFLALPSLMCGGDIGDGDEGEEEGEDKREGDEDEKEEEEEEEGDSPSLPDFLGSEELRG